MKCQHRRLFTHAASVRVLTHVLVRAYKSSRYADIHPSPRELRMISWLIYLLLSAGSLTLIARFLPGFHLRNFGHAVLAAGVYGVLQTVLSGILSVIAFIPIMLTFGLFVFVINAFILFLTDKLLEGFQIENLTTTLVGAVALTVLNGFWRFLLF